MYRQTLDAGVSIGWRIGAKVVTPEADGFVADDNSPLSQQIFYVSETQTESMLEPYGIADDLW